MYFPAGLVPIRQNYRYNISFQVAHLEETSSTKRVFGDPRADRPNERADREDSMAVRATFLAEGSIVSSSWTGFDGDVC